MEEFLLAGWQHDDGVDRLKRGIHARAGALLTSYHPPGRGTKTQKIDQKNQARPLVGRIWMARRCGPRGEFARSATRGAPS
jgi:hypothetical protein